MIKKHSEQHANGMMGSQSKPIICENELWLHKPKASEDLQRALTWAQKNPPQESSAGDIEKLRERK